jgi:hypothetical protein
MRSSIFALVSFALVSCGGSSGHSVDSPPDTPATSTLKVTTFNTSGPVNTQLVVVQDGDGPWTAVSGSAGVYTTTLHDDHYAFAVACTATYSSVYAIYAAVSDGTSWYVDDCSDLGPPAATIRGTVTGAASANAVRVINGSDFVDLAAGTTAYTLPTSAGPSRVFAEELVNNRPIKIVSIDTTVTDGGTVDLNLASGYMPLTHTVSANSSLLSASLSYRHVNSIARIDRGASPFTDYRGIPADQLGTGLNRLLVSSAGATANGTVIRYFTTPADEAITFPAALQVTHPPTATATPYPTAATKLPVDAGVTLYDFNFSTTNPTTTASHEWFAELTAAYVAKAFPDGTLAYAMPDLHGVPGWQAAFQLEAGQPIDWNIDESTNVNIDLFNAVPPDQFAYHDGGEERVASDSGQIAAP